MGTAPRKQLASASHKRPRQPTLPKRTYKIPRSLKKAIKRKLVKIVKERERKIRDEERKKVSMRHKAIMSGIDSQLRTLSEISYRHPIDTKLSKALDDVIHHGVHNLGFEDARQKRDWRAQKDVAREYLQAGSENENLQDRTRAWLNEQGGNEVEVKKLDQEEEAEDKNEFDDGANELDTTEEYDWTSTSTLE